MTNNKLKFDKLSDLLNEIDTWIDKLQNKKKEILSKIDLDAVKQAFPEDKGRYITDKLTGKVDKRISTGVDNINKFTSFATVIDASNYDLLKQEADKLNLSVSSFLKNNYFMNFVYDPNLRANYVKEYTEIQNTIKDQLIVKEKRSIGLALNFNDTELLKKAAEAVETNQRDLIRFFANQFMYDKLVKKSIRPAYVSQDSHIQYVKCVSSNVMAFGYDAKTKKLFVIFGGGRKYRYDNVPQEIYDDLCLADSKGQYVNNVLKIKYKGIKIN